MDVSEVPFPQLTPQPVLRAEGFKVSVIFLNIPSGDEGKEKNTRERSTSLHTNLLSVQVWGGRLKANSRHTVLGRSQELPWRLAAPKGINRNPFGNYQFGNVIPLIVTDIKQLRFVEEEQRPGLSSNKHRASCSLHGCLLPHDSLIPDLPSAEAINHTVEVDLKCLKLPGED